VKQKLFKLCEEDLLILSWIKTGGDFPSTVETLRYLIRSFPGFPSDISPVKKLINEKIKPHE